MALKIVSKITPALRTFKEMWDNTPETHRGPGWFIPEDLTLREMFPVVVKCPRCQEPAPVSIKTSIAAFNIIKTSNAIYVCVNHTRCNLHSVYQFVGWRPEHTNLIGIECRFYETPEGYIQTQNLPA